MHFHNTPAKVAWKIPLESALSFIPSLIFWETTLGWEGEKSIRPFIRASMSPGTSDVGYSAMYSPMDHKEKKLGWTRFSQTALSDGKCTEVHFTEVKWP